MDVVEENREESSSGMEATLEAAEQALQKDRVTRLTGQQGVYGLGAEADRTGRRPFLRIAVRRDRRVSGGLRRGGGERGQEERLSEEEKQVCGVWIKLDPGARKCFLIGTTAGEKTPERTEEQGETVRLSEAGEVTGHPLSLSQPSDRRDSLDEAIGVKASAESVGLVLFGKKPELTSGSPAASPPRRWGTLPCLSTAASMKVVPAAMAGGRALRSGGVACS